MNLSSPSLWGETILHPNARWVKQRYLLGKVHYTPYGTITCYTILDMSDHEIGKAVKCDLCIEKRGREEAPACTTVCPTRCIFWGDPEEFPSGIEVAL
jgi:ferredoxin